MKKSWISLCLFFLFAGTCLTVSTEAAAQSQPSGFGTPKDDTAWGLASHGSGVYVVGTTEGNLHSRQRGGGDAFIRKYDESGAFIWGRQFGTVQADNAWGAATDVGGNVYIVGDTEGALTGSARGGSDGFVRKYNADGKMLWTRQFGTKDNEYLGDMAIAGASLYVVGHRADGASGTAVALVERLDSSGHEVWSRTFGTLDYNYAAAVATDHEGNAYVAGVVAGLGPVSSPTLTSSDMSIRKYRPDGTLAWAKRLDYGKAENAFGVAVLGSSVYLAGFYIYQNDPDNRDVRIVKFATGGSKLWDKRFDLGGNDYLYSLSAFHGGVVFAGETVTPAGDSNGYVVKLTLEGKRVWQTRLATPRYDTTEAVIITRTGVYAAGETAGTLGSSSRGKSDAYLARLCSSDGRSIWIDQ